MQKLLPSRKIAHLSILLLFIALGESTVAHAAHKKAHAPVASSGAASATSASAPLDSNIPLEVWNNPAWQHGPMTVQLGQAASLDVPAGFRYLPAPPAQADQHASGASDAGDNAGAQEDDPPIAALAPEDGSWSMRVILSHSGHVDTDYVSLNPEELASTMQVRSNPVVPGAPPSARFLSNDMVDWIRTPRWDANGHQLDWLYENTVIGSSAMRSTSYLNAVKFGRRYTVGMQIELEDSNSKERAIALKDTFDRLVGSVKFREGETYADYRSGDEKATLKVTDYITGPKTAADEEFDQKIARATGFDWRGFAERVLPILSLGFVGFAAMRRKKQSKPNQS
ncbi:MULTISPECIES: DUF2167 domain-containing protein [unclassified Paraburkholderia]|uniref:DUF2167 domain-containing protein n=1 Tax=unclassified Paraburkholderia TaxID=2615204 RepID=UPI000D319AB7|nr:MULTISPECIES: DUF2167 domain-containing protein [unclassified Paraburkholderia]